jgi:proteic killer suppression protein
MQVFFRSQLKIRSFAKKVLYLSRQISSMIVTFEEKYLQELYESGKTTDKKHRFQPEIVRKYQLCIQYLRGASRIETLATLSF